MERFLKKHLKNGHFLGVSYSRSQIMSKIRGKSNRSTELKFRIILIRSCIRGWHLNHRLLKGKPDFYFTKKRVAIFIDGCYWHGCPICGHIPKTRSAFWRAKINRNRERDKKVNYILRKSDIRVLRFWEHELKSKRGIAMVLQKLKKAISR